ncbi:unnamed protein product [Cochlearia groenlandica]
MSKGVGFTCLLGSDSLPKMLLLCGWRLCILRRCHFLDFIGVRLFFLGNPNFLSFNRSFLVGVAENKSVVAISLSFKTGSSSRLAHRRR